MPQSTKKQQYLKRAKLKLEQKKKKRESIKRA